MTTTGPKGRRGRPPRGSATLSRERVVEAALALVDEEGLDQISMRKIAQRLRVDPMSLYNHVADKDDVLDGIAEALLAGIPAPPADGSPRERMEAVARGFRTAMLAHPKAAPTVLTRQLASPAGLAPLAAAVAPLLDAGCPPREAVHALRAALGFLVGSLLREVNAGPSFGTDPAAGGQRRRTLESAELPSLTAIAPHLAVCDHEAEFEYGLDLVLTAVERKLPG
ncbi:TetR/AcrR family transcriptional regulator C-terminal domain-containing protein [Saccharopolyspora gregorii]|uniref:TetR/AcrR family transcriptional regulator C-terminal domain-containing protein n=1 Tax=Saccharopolyspora gregorii TaxID=33914 RepID=UPI0021ABE0A6|nr:TetR/AcrR family transcriptional regulator C-terminal domain-containing protein [Saccharopolyspora gregorii]